MSLVFELSDASRCDKGLPRPLSPQTFRRIPGADTKDARRRWEQVAGPGDRLFGGGHCTPLFYTPHSFLNFFCGEEEKSILEPRCRTSREGGGEGGTGGGRSPQSPSPSPPTFPPAPPAPLLPEPCAPPPGQARRLISASAAEARDLEWRQGKHPKGCDRCWSLESLNLRLLRPLSQDPPP